MANPQDTKSTMRSLAVEKYSTPDKYQIFQLPIPQVKEPNEILIKVHAVSINPVDVHVANGLAKMIFSTTFPHKIGYDLSGTIVATGSAVPSHLKPGTEVYSRVPEKYRGTGAEYALSTAEATAIKPKSTSHNQSAAVPLASLTALQALDFADSHFEGGLRGKTVFIPAGLSGTGGAAIQLAKNVFGAGKVITTLSTSKIPLVDEMIGKGVVDQIIDYTKEDPSKIIPAASVDYIFDTMNLAMPSLHLMKKGGLILTVSGMPFGPKFREIAPNLPTILHWAIGAFGSFLQFRARRYGVTYLYHYMQDSGKDLDRLSEWIDQGKLKVIVGKTANLNDIQDVRNGCQQVFDGKGGIGKFVIEIGS